MFKGYFISGSDTNVGKTIVSAILVNKLMQIILNQFNVEKTNFLKQIQM